MKRSFSYVLIFFFSLVYLQTVAQEVRVIDNKGTRQTVNNNQVTTSTTAPTNPVENDIWFDSNTTPATTKVWEYDKVTNTGAWVEIIRPTNWLINGNSGTNSTNFLGNIDDVKMQIRSNNVPMLEFGRRQTLGLTQTGRTDYDDNNQSLVYLNGSGGTSALQFRADAANFYKPMFFTTSNGSFRLKGSTGRTDLFEIGSAGPDNDGRLEFIVGDDGTEPIVFKRFDYRSGEFYREFFRVQGSNNTTNAKTRFGININQNNYPVTGNVNANSNGGTPAKIMANSTFQVNGSISKSIITVPSGPGNFILTEDHYTVLVGINRRIQLPDANTCIGRIYVIKNIRNSGRVFITPNYIDTRNTSTNRISSAIYLRAVQLQSDGTNWHQIN